MALLFICRAMDCSEGGGLKRRYLSLYIIWEELHLERGALSSFIPREFSGTDSNMTKSLFPSSVEEGATGVMPRVSPGPDMPIARVHQKPGPEGSVRNAGVRILGWAEGT